MKKEYDLQQLKKRKGKPKVDSSATKVAISLRLDGADLATIKDEAEKRGLPYQTFLGSIIHQYVSGELIEKRVVEILNQLNA